MKAKIAIVLGPTAVGKSEIALDLAEQVHGEIANADSQQVYRYMNIGTGKPSEADRERVVHHLIDIVNPDEEFNAALYRRLASESIDEIHKRGGRVIVCGGTGLYLKALTQGIFTGPGPNLEIRKELDSKIHEGGLGPLYRRLVDIDPAVTSTIHPNDRQRIIRALEVYETTGRPLSVWQKEHSFHERPFEVLKIGLSRERSELYDLINRRSEAMVHEGLLDEVQALVAHGYGLDLKPLCSVGYRQMGEVIRGMKNLPEALEEMKQETRHLAKRQLTWFRRDPAIRWFHPQEQQRQIAELVTAFLR